MSTNPIIFNYRKDVLKVYHPVYNTNKTHNYMIYGRDSGKTRFMPYLLLSKFLKYQYANVIIIRRYQNTIKRSVFEAIRKEIYRKGLQDDFNFKESDLIIEDTTNGTRFYFFGADDENKIRSTVMKQGVPCFYWIEEWQEFKTIYDLEQIEEVITTFMREKLPQGWMHRAFYTGNMPREKFDDRVEHLNKMKDFDPEQTAFYYATYKDMVDNSTGETLLNDQELRRIALYQEKDPDTYEWRWLGKSVGSDLEIYNADHLKTIKQLPEDEKILSFDIIIDTGYQVSATTFLAIGITNKRNPILIETKYYAPSKEIEKRIPLEILKPHEVAKRKEEKYAPSEFAKELADFKSHIQKTYKISCEYEIVDSAEGALRNEYYRKYHIFLRTVSKKDKETMIEELRDVLVERVFYVYDLPCNKIAEYEFKKYRREVKRSGEKVLVKVDDHTVDCMQYYAVYNKRKLNMR